MKKISFTYFTRLLTNQPYFVWNQGQINTDNEEIDLDLEAYSYQDVADTSIQEVQAKSFYLIEKAFEKKVASKMTNAFFVRDKSIEDRIKRTKWAMDNKEITTIINPVFGFEYKGFQIIAQPKFFSKINNEIGFLKISTSTRSKDILRFMFDYLVLKKIGIEIDDASLYILAKKDYYKNEVDFYKTKYINTTKASRVLRKVNGFVQLPKKVIKKLPDSPPLEFLLHFQQLKKTGQGTNRKGIPDEKYTIAHILKRRKIKKVKFKSLEFYLDEIINAKKIKKIEPPTLKDASPFESTLNWDLILKETKNIWHGYSGKIIKRSDVIENKPKKILLKKSFVAESILKNVIVLDVEMVTIILEQLEGSIIWYDFEAVSIPFCIIDHTLPFAQVVSQVSIIETTNLEEKKVINLVLDPRKVHINNFIKIINAIYKQGFKYAVYNKAYENTRLKDMVKILYLENHPQLHEMEKKVGEIIDNTIDLADLFHCSANKMPLILIPNLKGKYSIKTIEKYISQSNWSLPYKIKEYKNLEISNGMKAMEWANQRALGIIGDNQWAQIRKWLKKYCENDVRAMIMVYYLVKKLLDQFQN